MNIKTVDFKLEMVGHGVVNNNGSCTFYSKDTKSEVKNHTMPKLRGFNSKVTLDNGDVRSVDPNTINLEKNPLYISANCLKRNLYREETAGLPSVLTLEDTDDILASFIGLCRGYMLTEKKKNTAKRKGSIFFEDMVDTLGNGNFEQFAKEGLRDKNSFFTKTTFGTTHYLCYGSVNIEDLRFISLDQNSDNSAISDSVVDKARGEKVAAKIENYLKHISKDKNKKPEAIFDGGYQRKSYFNMNPIAGILLNDDAIDTVIAFLKERLENLYIRQGNGWAKTSNVLMDYNNSTPFRIKKSEANAVEERTTPYEEYFSKSIN